MARSTKQDWRPSLTGKIHPEAEHAIRLLYDAIADHDSAIVNLAGKGTTSSSASTSKGASPGSGASTAASAATVTGQARVAKSPTDQIAANSSATAATNSSFGLNAYISGINNQSGTTYSVQDTDYNGLIVFNTNSPVTVTLNSAVSTNFTCIVMNLGTSQITLTPSTGTINYAGSMTLQVAASSGMFFDGVNWFAMTTPNAITPQNLVAIAHKFVTGYNATTGAWTTAQPDFTDISGTVSNAQLPAGVATLSGTSGSLGGTLMAVGDTVRINVTITGATVGMVAVCSPNTYPGDGYVWDAFIGTTNIAVVRLTCVAAGTPVASVYSVRILT